MQCHEVRFKFATPYDNLRHFSTRVETPPGPCFHSHVGSAAVVYNFKSQRFPNAASQTQLAWRCNGLQQAFPRLRANSQRQNLYKSGKALGSFSLRIRASLLRKRKRYEDSLDPLGPQNLPLRASKRTSWSLLEALCPFLVPLPSFLTKRGAE